ncbi:MAG TPA: hypothetical protein VF257_14880 [Solirubrobacteraceae bacterium]
MKRARWIALAVALAGTVALPSSAAAKLAFNLPAQIFKVFDTSAKTGVDKNRCEAVVFVEFPKIAHAVGYRIVVKDTGNGSLDDYVAPPFDTYGRGFIAKFPPPDPFARFFVGAYSTGEGCAAADANTESRQIVEAKVSLDKPFEKRFKRILKPPWKRAYKPGERTVKLSPRGRRKVIVRRLGEVTTIDKGTNQPINVFTNRYATSGAIVKTGANSVVQIGSLDGNSVLVGPHMTVRITNDGIEILEAPRHVRPWRVTSHDDYKVQTDNAVLSSRG